MILELISPIGKKIKECKIKMSGLSINLENIGIQGVYLFKLLDKSNNNLCIKKVILIK